MKCSQNRWSRGQDLIEYAITLPIFLVLVFGFIDLWRAAYYFSALQNGAREGARYAIVHPGNNTGIETMVRGKLIGLDQDDITVLTTVWTDETVKVTVQFSFTPVTPIIGSVFPGGVISMESSSTMLREQWN
jgi:Flp pilus assembly protein TadG